jgi:hypothetical protein
MMANHGQIEWFNSIFASGKENIQPARAEKLSNGDFLGIWLGVSGVVPPTAPN